MKMRLLALAVIAASLPLATFAADKVTLKVVRADSEETGGEDGKAANAVDGDNSTFWHTQWQDSSPAHPHEIVIELTPPCSIKGFTYLARQDDSENGSIQDYEFYVSEDGKDFGNPVKKGSFERTKEKQTATFESKHAKFIKLKALSEINGEAWTSAAEIGIVQDTGAAAVRPASEKLALKVIKVDSEETGGEDGKGANAVDGDPSTFWHTQWQDANPAHPHEIVIELTPHSMIKGFTYLARQDDSENGSIQDYEFYVSEDGKDFGKPVKKGSFQRTKEKQTATFEATHARFIKLKALSEINGEAWTSAAEIGVVRD